MVFLISGYKFGGVVNVPRLSPATACAKAEQLEEAGYWHVRIQAPDGRRFRVTEFRTHYNLHVD